MTQFTITATSPATSSATTTAPVRRAPTMVLTSITLAVLTMMGQAQAQQAEEQIQRVEVTGSSIKRLATEAALPVTTMKAEEFAKRGMTTLADVMMALPQSASLAPSNAGSGTNINLRGLGVNRTLVLLNGRRLANEAIADGYANLDIIPMSALSRVEILRDGASSIYGSNAIGGVVNFITKASFEGASITGQYIQPEKHGGGDEQRASITVGRGSLARDGWNVYATIDAHERSRLAARDRAELSTPELLASIGRAPSLATGGFATPANFTTAANKTAANPYASNCLAPFSIKGAKNTCVLDNNEYGTALYENQQVTFFAKGTKRFSDEHTMSLEYLRGQSYIIATRNPTTSLAAAGVTAQLPSTSKWYPGASGGVPAVAGVTGQPLLVTWSVADLGLAATKDIQVNQRLALDDQGRLGNWDYKLGVVYGSSERENFYHNGYMNGPGLLAGIKSGALNPFGLQDQAGRDYLASISVDGQKNRYSKSTFAGVDVNFSRPLMQLAGGEMALAVGADFHRDTTEDNRLAIVSQVTYANASPSRGAGARNVSALFAELDIPVTKTLNINLAARNDYFSDFGNTFNPKASFRWEPMKTLMFRGSANTGFRAPTLFDAYGYRLPGANGLTSSKWDDPVLCPGTPGVAGSGTAKPGYVTADVCNVQLPRQTGSNADLKPETSKGFTLGMVIEPAKDLTVSFDYWDIRMKDMLANLPEQAYFLNPAKYASLFVRKADGTLDYIQNTTMNLAGQKAAGVDVSATYAFPRSTTYGDFRVQLDGTYLTRFDNQLEAGSPWVSNIGRFGLASNGTTSSFPIITFRWKHTLALSWKKGDVAAQLTQNYNAGYEDQNLVAAQYHRDIAPYKVWNLTGTYSGFKNITIIAGITNMLDAKPPVTNHSGYSNGYLSSAASPIGRAYNVSATYAF